MLSVCPHFSNLAKQNNRKQWSLLAWLWVWRSGSLMTHVLSVLHWLYVFHLRNHKPLMGSSTPFFSSVQEILLNTKKTGSDFTLLLARSIGWKFVAQCFFDISMFFHGFLVVQVFFQLHLKFLKDLSTILATMKIYFWTINIEKPFKKLKPIKKSSGHKLSAIIVLERSKDHDVLTFQMGDVRLNKRASKMGELLLQERCHQWSTRPDPQFRL